MRKPASPVLAGLVYSGTHRLAHLGAGQSLATALVETLGGAVGFVWVLAPKVDGLDSLRQERESEALDQDP